MNNVPCVTKHPRLVRSTVLSSARFTAPLAVRLVGWLGCVRPLWRVRPLRVACPLILVFLVAGCNRSETTSLPTPSPATSPTPPAASATLDPATNLEASPEAVRELVPETAVKTKDGKIVSLDLRSLSGDELAHAITVATQIDTLEDITLTGEAVTDSLVQPFLEMPSITRLRLPQTRITDSTLATLAQSGRLRLLDITDVSTIGQAGIASIGKMNQLVELNLMNTAVSDDWLDSLSQLSALKKLRLRGTKITGENMTALATLPIVDLELAETSFSNAGMDAIAKMPKLEKLNLWLTKIDDEGLAKLQGKTSLKLLNLDNVSGITNKSLPLISELKALELLHLGGTSVTESALEPLQQLVNLKTLFITRLGVSETAANKLRQAMPQLERLEY